MDENKKVGLGVVAGALLAVSGMSAMADGPCKDTTLSGISADKEIYPDGGFTGAWVGIGHGRAYGGKKDYVEGDATCRAASLADMEKACQAAWVKAYCK